MRKTLQVEMEDLRSRSSPDIQAWLQRQVKNLGNDNDMRSNWREKIDGLTVGAWKSLAVKSLRLGWLFGLEAAEIRLGKTYMRACMTCGVFEDIFPAVNELSQVAIEVDRLDYAALCRRETHHMRGHTGAFCAYEKEACEAAANDPGPLYMQAKNYGIKLPPRSLNCWYTWYHILPQDEGKRRTVDMTPWTTMPTAMLDGHTMEGKSMKVVVTLLSGHYSNHLTLSKTLPRLTWDGLRAQVHGSGNVVVEGRSVQRVLC
jgi:hypothetical protein